MNRRWAALAASGVALAATQASGNPARHPVSARHQLIACMTKEMTASKTISYNEATKLCRAQLKVEAPTLASTIAAKPSGVLRP